MYDNVVSNLNFYIILRILVQFEPGMLFLKTTIVILFDFFFAFSQTVFFKFVILKIKFF